MRRWLSLPLAALFGFVACADEKSLLSPPPPSSSPDASVDAGNDASTDSYEVLSNPPNPEAMKVGTGGAAATVDVRATLAAIEILKRGGNAIDAAVAAAAVLGVTDPFSCGIGGGGFMVIHLAKENRTITIDHREKAPRAHQRTLFYKEDGKPHAYWDNVTSGVSIGVPGTVRGWDEALRRYGTKTLHDVLQPGIWVAEKGFILDQTFVNQTGSTNNLPRFKRIKSTRELYLNSQGELRTAGERFMNPNLGKAYRKIADEGARAFYEGDIAKALVNTVTKPPETFPPDPSQPAVPLRPGVMSLDDLSSYEVRIRLPTQVTYRDYTVYGMGAPGSGGLAVGQTLNLLGQFAAGADDELLHHRYIEASRIAFADRNAFLGDPEFVNVPQQGMLSPAYAAQRKAEIGESAATVPAREGNPFAHQEDPSPGTPPAQVSPFENSPGALTTETTHLTVSDKDGNVVAYTFTIEEEGGSGIVVPEYGFLLNNELTDFDIRESAATPAANISEAGKRPRSSMTPTIVFNKEGKPAFAVGSPGGARIITTVGQTVVNVLDRNMTLFDAVAAPRVSQRNSTDTKTEAEQAFIDSDIGKKLTTNRGHQFTLNAVIGAATGIQFNADGTVTAVAEPVRRGGGSAMVVDAK